MPDATAVARPTFDGWIAGHARGTLNDELTFEMAEIVKAVQHLDKKGTLTLTLTVEPAGAGGRTVIVSGKVKAAPPVAAPEVGLWYPDETGVLHKDDPTVQRIPGVPFANSDGDLVKVDPATGEVIPAKEA